MILVLILIILSISIVGFSLYTGISPMPSSRAAQNAFLNALPRGILQIYELGSGWGGLAFCMARNRPEATVYAFELSWLPWFVSICRRVVGRYHNVKIYRKNFFYISFHSADAVVCYLYPGAMLHLRPQLEAELKVGSCVISNSFAIPGWKPQQVIAIPDLWSSNLYVYRHPIEAPSLSCPCP